MNKENKRIFEKYYLQYKDTVYKYFCMMTEKEEAKILFEETWLDVWKWMSDTIFLEEADVKGYLFRNCKIRAEEYLDKKKPK